MSKYNKLFFSITHKYDRETNESRRHNVFFSFLKEQEENDNQRKCPFYDVLETVFI